LGNIVATAVGVFDGENGTITNNGVTEVDGVIAGVMDTLGVTAAVTEGDDVTSPIAEGEFELDAGIGDNDGAEDAAREAD